MPRYEYQCGDDNCGKITEIAISFSARKDSIECPDCHSQANIKPSLCGATYPTGRCKGGRGGLDRPKY